MEISLSFVVYELCPTLNSKHLCLKKVEFKGWQTNSFKTKEEAIEVLLKENKTYEDFAIIEQVYIRKEL